MVVQVTGVQPLVCLLHRYGPGEPSDELRGLARAPAAPPPLGPSGRTADEQREVAVLEGGGGQQQAAAVARLVHALLARRVHVHESARGAAGRAATEVPVDHALAVVQPVLRPHHARALTAQHRTGAGCPAHCRLGHHGAAGGRGPGWPWWRGEVTAGGVRPKGTGTGWG